MKTLENIKKYIRSNRELAKENEILKDNVETLLHYYCAELVENEILRHQFHCSCFNEKKEQRIEAKKKFYSKVFIKK